MWMLPAVYPDVQWIKNEMYKKWTVALPQIRYQLHDYAKQYDDDDACHNYNGMVESCIEIYLEMAMEIP